MSLWITSVQRSDLKKLEMAESIGADILIDRSKEVDWSKAVFLATDKRGVDVVVDNVGTTFRSEEAGNGGVHRRGYPDRPLKRSGLVESGFPCYGQTRGGCRCG